MPVNTILFSEHGAGKCNKDIPKTNSHAGNSLNSYIGLYVPSESVQKGKNL